MAFTLHTKTRTLVYGYMDGRVAVIIQTHVATNNRENDVAPCQDGKPKKLDALDRFISIVGRPHTPYCQDLSYFHLDAALSHHRRTYYD